MLVYIIHIIGACFAWQTDARLSLMTTTQRRNIGWICFFQMLCGLCAACGYQSQYVPPIDGKARVVWHSRDSEAVVSVGGLAITADCQTALRLLTRRSRMPLDTGDSMTFPEPTTEQPLLTLHTESVFWVPRYYGPNIVVVNPGMAPVFARPPVFTHPMSRFPVGTVVSKGAPGGGVSRGGGVRLGGGGDAGRGLAVLAAVALVVMPAISIPVAVVRPESERQASEAIDGTNALNDLVRSGQLPCAAEMSPPSGGTP